MLLVWLWEGRKVLEYSLLVHKIEVIPYQWINLLLVVNLIVHMVDLLFLKVQTN